MLLRVSPVAYLSRIQTANLKPVGLTLEPIASAEAVLSEEEKDAGVVLVDIGGGTTDVAIFKDGIIRHTAVVPLGGNIITDDIKNGCGILARQAEMLKVQYGSAWPGENRDNEIVSIPGIKGKEPKEITLKNLSKIIHSRVSEIINLVLKVIENYGYQEAKKKLFAGIVLTGGGSQLKHIVQLVEYITGMDTRIGYPDEHLADNSDPKLTSPIYATAIGLVMNAIENQAEEQFKKRLEELKAQEVTEADDRAEIPAEQPVNKTEKVITTIIDDSAAAVSRKIEEDDEEEEEPKSSKGFWEKVSKKIKNFIGETEEEI